jgi:hypothetical protein
MGSREMNPKKKKSTIEEVEERKYLILLRISVRESVIWVAATTVDKRRPLLPMSVVVVVGLFLSLL